MMHGPFAGLLVPTLTPFDSTLAPDVDRFVKLCERLLSLGADGLALFGTTGEANSMSASERKSLLSAVCHHGIPGSKLMPGIGSCSVSESADLLAHAAEVGAAGALLLPPFFYKGAAATDDGLFDFFAQVMRRTEGAATKIYLYHIPPVAQIGWSIELIGRLIAAFPERLAGLKDSSGNWEHTQSLIETFPGFDIFPGSELFLLDGLRAGGVGCITATGNINPTGIREVYASRKSFEADALQKQATEVRLAVQSAGNPIAVLKAYLALKSGDDNWSRVRPPLRAESRVTAEKLDSHLSALGFDFNVFC
jgi:4-hydroxy-tetrahydrodipicolinate synthase